MKRTTVHVDELRGLGWPWPPHPYIETKPADDGTIDLVAARARAESSHAFWKREQDGIYAFASKWGADVDDVTDRRGEYAEKVYGCGAALGALDELVDAISETPPRRKS